MSDDRNNTQHAPAHGEAAPLAKGPDMNEDGERRLHLRAYDYWQDLTGDQGLPFFHQLDVEGLRPYRDCSLLVERNHLASDDVPAITVRFLGDGLAPLFSAMPKAGDDFRDFSQNGFARELLALLDNRSAASRAAEFEYVDVHLDSRGILLPLRHKREDADFLWVVISAKYYDGLLDSSGAMPQSSMSGLPSEASVQPSNSVENDILSNLLEDARKEAGSVLEEERPGFTRLYGLLAEVLRIYEEGEANPPGLAQLLEAHKLKRQARAPFTPILKMILGKDYDKTRLTEYGTALAYAQRQGIASNRLVAYLESAPGGIKGCVQKERAARRQAKGSPEHSRLAEAKEALRAAPALARVQDSIESEFILMLARRNEEGGADIIGRVNVGERTLSTTIQSLARERSKDPSGRTS